MKADWTVKDNTGQLLADFAANSRLDVGRKLVPQRVDPFRLQVSASSGRRSSVRGWQIVRVRA